MRNGGSESSRFVTGVSWVDHALWHGTWEGEESDLRRIDPETGEVLEVLELPQGIGVGGLEGDGAGLFYCGGGPSSKLRAVRHLYTLCNMTYVHTDSDSLPLSHAYGASSLNLRRAIGLV